MEQSIRTISLFSGGGGLDIGFEKAGFDILFATDIDHDCCETLKLNRGITLNKNLKVEETDIHTLNLDILPKDVDLIIGGPPCQSFSASGRRAGGASGQLDQRGMLFKSYCKVVDYVKPKAFLFENVRGILGTNHGEDFRSIKASFEALGYNVDYRILDAEDYGVPQQRERLIIVGHKSDKPFLFPKPVFGPDSSDQKNYVAVKDAISDLPFTDKDKEETKFEGGKYSHLLPLVPPGDNYLFFTAKRGYLEPVFAYRSRFSDFLYKANPDRPVKTLIASPGKYTGPLHWDNRYLTVSEYKRIQGFPDKHVFYGDRSHQIRQIGNSVCPKLAFYLALAIRDQIFGIESDIEYLSEDDVLSFDKRKSQKAKKTKAYHQAVEEREKEHFKKTIHVHDFSGHVTPTELDSSFKNVRVKKVNENEALVNVYAEDSDAVAAVLKLTVFDGVNKEREISLKVVLYGDTEYGVQTMWNAVDLWVKESSNFYSLIELYGHFTEPHPIFRVDSFENRSELPIYKFAEHCMNFENCSIYFKKEHLLSMWGETFDKNSFIELEKLLRGYRFDIRSHETNIAIPQGVYMVAYPFTLPYDKQMNFFVHDREDEDGQEEGAQTGELRQTVG